MRFASLGSGSQGNGTLVEWDDQLVLVDCGFTVREVERRIALLKRNPGDITAILVTHEHADHLKGVAPLARKYRIPVYMTPGTWHSRELGKLPLLNLIEGYASFSLGSARIQPVAVPHDAREPAQFVIEVRKRRLGLLTDLGTVSAHVVSHYRRCDALLLEANHDPSMLSQGPYPAVLKRRVGGPWGHLSNDQSVALLERVDRARLQTLVIGHISQQNNCPERVREAISGVVREVDRIGYACQAQGFDWLTM